MSHLFKLSKIVTVIFTVWGILASSSQCIFGEDKGIFVVSAIYSIKPDGTCQETKDGAFGNLAKKNVHWDSTTKTISLYAAKNEEVGVQIVIPMEGKGYSAQMGELKGNGAIGSDRASFSMVAWATSPKGTMIPDLVIPLDGTIAGIKAVDVPIAVKGLPSADNKVGVILFEL